MVWLMRRCSECGKYTLNQEKCPYCNGRVRVPHPAKFSLDDKYLKYRLALKKVSSIGEDDHHREDKG